MVPGCETLTSPTDPRRSPGWLICDTEMGGWDDGHLYAEAGRGGREALSGGGRDVHPTRQRGRFHHGAEALRVDADAKPPDGTSPEAADRPAASSGATFAEPPPATCGRLICDTEMGGWDDDDCNDCPRDLSLGRSDRRRPGWYCETWASDEMIDDSQKVWFPVAADSYDHDEAADLRAAWAGVPRRRIVCLDV